MQFFTATMEQLSAYQELMRARQEGVTPVSFTGVSQIHKAHLLAALSQTSHRFWSSLPTKQRHAGSVMMSTPCWKKLRHGYFRRKK